MERVGYSDELVTNSRYLKETNDCTVIAWANCFDCSYLAAHAWMKKHGRPNRRGMRAKDVETALKSCTKAGVKIGPYNRENMISLNKFVEKHNKGRYYVLVRGHALCVKDGVVHYFTCKPRRQVVFAARIYLEGEI